MKIGKNGIEYSVNEHFDISNKGEQMLKKYHSEGKCMYDKCTNNSIYSHTISKMGALSSISVNDQLGYFVSKCSLGKSMKKQKRIMLYEWE